MYSRPSVDQALTDDAPELAASLHDLADQLHTPCPPA
ncbi:hypothetical protein X759_30985 [Mesorhizobium sp. LSHC420B00]|nr:hypothetical protein X759_30985 [Mesorhizobium sp. LSHC420B00]